MPCHACHVAECGAHTHACHLTHTVQIALAVSALALADRAACAPTYSTALFASAIVFSLVLLCAPRYFQPARRTSQDPVLIAAEAQRRRRINNIDLLCLIPFIIANVAVFSVSSCNVDAPLLFYSNLTLVIIGYMYFCSPLTWCILAVAFSPCLFLLFHYMQRTQALRANPFDGRMGATEDIINAIPVFTYRKKVVPEPRPDIEAPADSPVSLAAVPPPAASAQTTSHASPASQASEPSGSSSPAKAAPPKRKRRKFNLLPSIFKRGKGSASDAGADADADAAQAAAQAAAGPKELELDAEDAVCCICLGEYDEGESLRQLACNHHFHVDCIDEWLKLNAKCPLCVRRLPDDGKGNKSGAASH
ncbi:hypothetical protein BC831DRAFT_285071 [Entophlyctis helioformis]|nr:hypothetical protein BC831DRAFT_285071 [Entophlyctis helioformis]